MPFSAGEIVTAARLNRIQPVTYEIAATGDITLSTTETDLTGASISITTQTDGAVYTVAGVYDMFAQAGSAGVVMVGRLSVDGFTDTEEAHADGSTTGARVTASQDWRGVLPAHGAHVFKMRVLKSGSGGTMLARLTHSKLNITIYEVV